MEVDFHMLDNYASPMISHHKIGALGRETLSSNKSNWIQVSCAAPSTKTLNLNPVEDLTIVHCFFNDQDTKVGP